jgi:predicted AAA+ superfamily ATPase
MSRYILLLFPSVQGNYGHNCFFNCAESPKEAGLVHRANVYDIRGKSILSSKCKYFLADMGLKHAVRSHRESDMSATWRTSSFWR